MGKNTMKNRPRITPVILAGGKGERLWPLSRREFPKQVIPLITEKSLLQETVERVADPALFAAPLIIADNDSRFIIAEQLSGRLVENIIIEPVGRSTAAAAAIAALYLLAETPDSLLLLLPSDHRISNRDAFLALVAEAFPIAAEGNLVTFGITPDKPETGYGYILRGNAKGQGEHCFAVESFKEKPDINTARSYLASGNYYWNSGMFLMPAALYLSELERFAPEILRHARQAFEKSEKDLRFVRLDAEAFARCPGISLDYAVMEKTSHAVVMPADIGWNDVGSWETLWELVEKDSDSNALIGDVLAIDSSGNYLRSEGKLLAALGLQDMIVVNTPDALLVAPKEKSQEVKQLTQKLVKEHRAEITSHTTSFRPWGNYTTLVEQPGFQVKRLRVKTGGKLSLQSHYHRSEHWIVVKGTARVTCGEKTFLLHENESTYIPTGIQHRLENPGKIELELIEVQSGSYLGEDDIVRYDDVYGRKEG